MRILRHLAFPLLLASAASPPVHSQLAGTGTPDEVLARAGPKIITAEEFLERIELMPWKDKELVAMQDSVKALALRSLVAEKLLALEAESRGIGTDEKTEAMLKGIDEMLTKDQLYKEEVVKKAVITEQEVERGWARYPWSLLVKGYLFPDRNAADRFVVLVQRAENPDSAATALGFMVLKVTDSIWVGYGDMSPSFEDAMYALHRPGFTAPAFSPSEGWVVFHVFDRRSNALWASQSMNERRIEVQKKARARIERERAMTFARSYMRQRPMHIDSTLFAVVADSVVPLVRSDTSESTQRLSAYVDVLREMFGNRLHETFASGNGNAWTLEDVLEALRYYPTEFPRKRNPRVIVYALNQFVMEAVEGEMLSAEGKRRGLDTVPEVRRQMNTWTDAVRGRAMGKSVVENALGPATGHVAQTDSARLARSAEVSDIMNKYIAGLAQKYGVELFEKKLKGLPISRFSMVTRHFVGFGGVLFAIPMIIPDWEWYYHLSSPVVAP